MKKVSLSGEPRAHVGKTDAKAVRNAGLVPAVIYGGKEQKFLNLKYNDIHGIHYSPDTYQVNISLEGKEYPAIIREVQFHPVTDKMIHVDFVELVPGKEVITEIPLKYEGQAIGVRAGGKLSKGLRKVRVKATPENMPDYVTVNIANLDLGQVLKVKELKLPNAKIMEIQERAVAAVKTTRNVAATPAEDAKAAAKAAPAKK